jgi:SAM-dependent methyltransferase
MRRDDERFGAPEFYEWLAPIYDDLYDAIDVEESVRQWSILLWKVARLPRAAGPRPRLLDLGCGTGRYLVEWAASGFDVTGVDASRAMVTRARRRAKTVAQGVPVPAVLHGDLRDQVRPLRVRGPFDVAVAHFNFLNLFTLEEVSVVLTRLASAMVPGAFLFADCPPPGLAAEGSAEALTLPNGGRLTISTESRKADRAILRVYRRNGSTRSERYHLHSSAELRRTARSAGWRVESVVEWRPDRVRAPWSFTRAARDRHRVYALRLSGTNAPPSRSS